MKICKTTFYKIEDREDVFVAIFLIIAATVFLIILTILLLASTNGIVLDIGYVILILINIWTISSNITSLIYRRLYDK